MKFATQYIESGRLYGDVVEADHIQAAIALVEFRGKGEVILGELVHQEEITGGTLPLMFKEAICNNQ